MRNGLGNVDRDRLRGVLSDNGADAEDLARFDEYMSRRRFMGRLGAWAALAGLEAGVEFARLPQPPATSCSALGPSKLEVGDRRYGRRAWSDLVDGRRPATDPRVLVQRARTERVVLFPFIEGEDKGEGQSQGCTFDKGPGSLLQPLGQYMMIDIPTRQIVIPSISGRSGRVPSRPQPQSSDRTMNMPP